MKIKIKDSDFFIDYDTGEKYRGVPNCGCSGPCYCLETPTPLNAEEKELWISVRKKTETRLENTSQILSKRLSEEKEKIKDIK